MIALVGGYDFNRSKFNRVIQAARQTGSAFKAFVYLSALDKGYTPATPIIDAPVVFEEQVEEGQDAEDLKDSKTAAKQPKTTPRLSQKPKPGARKMTPINSAAIFCSAMP